MSTLPTAGALISKTRIPRPTRRSALTPVRQAGCTCMVIRIPDTSHERACPLHVPVYRKTVPEVQVAHEPWGRWRFGKGDVFSIQEYWEWESWMWDLATKYNVSCKEMAYPYAYAQQAKLRDKQKVYKAGEVVVDGVTYSVVAQWIPNRVQADRAGRRAAENYAKLVSSLTQGQREVYHTMLEDAHREIETSGYSVEVGTNRVTAHFMYDLMGIATVLAPKEKDD